MRPSAPIAGAFCFSGSIALLTPKNLEGIGIVVIDLADDLKGLVDPRIGGKNGYFR